ncbi:MAG: DUF4388 domain-containing protein [Lentisphaeria bacterium]|nr:DUF4388 domain-containing protein [Lentisphaeria bacterium]
MTDTPKTTGNTAWTWDEGELRRLRAVFRTELQAFLRVTEKAPDAVDDAYRARVAALLDRMEQAAAELDVCAANCHSLARSLRAWVQGDDTHVVVPEGSVRLRSALGQEVMLTRTTIAQLAGKPVRLEYIDGANAIVQTGGEYWGTPWDRVVVMPDAEDRAYANTHRNVNRHIDAVFRCHLRSGELSNAVQFLTMTRRHGILHVHFPGGREEGAIVCDDGRVVHAAFRDTEGIEAFARMMRMGEAEAWFDSTSRIDPERHTVSLSTDQLLIEAAVKADEFKE